MPVALVCMYTILALLLLLLVRMIPRIRIYLPHAAVVTTDF